MQSISPGLVETEFLSRTFDAEVAKAIYGSVESLQPKDIAESVIYILQAPPHVEINDIILQPTETNNWNIEVLILFKNKLRY